MNTALLAVAAYLIGSVSFAVIVSRAFSLPDPRTYGSGNPGATNVLRSGRKSAAVITLLGDALKGWLAVWVAARFAAPGDVELTMALAGALSVVGHMFPVFHRFEGGKGVATALGVLFGFHLYIALGAISTWIIIAVFFRMSSLASITAAAFAPFATWMFYGFTHPFFASVVIVAVLLIYRHYANIQKILAGTESKLGQKATL
ncbi:MAG: glycerol-3-phosphate 1-O-acyltransferase PlsY [Burkholderiales bacterium]